MNGKKPIVLMLFLAACGKGSTGSSLVTFLTLAKGPDTASDGTLQFVSGRGAAITLTKARIHIGAVYLNQSVPLSGASSEPCIAPGTYVAQIFGPLDVDLLAKDAVEFPHRGEGTATPAKTAEVWLTGGDINAEQDAATILEVAGTAVQAGITYPFTSSITIGTNRKPKVTNPALPGANPICHQRIVTPIAVDMTPGNSQTMTLKIDPRPMLNAVDFSQTTKISDAPPLYRIEDDTAPSGQALYKGLMSNYGVYQFTWTE